MKIVNSFERRAVAIDRGRNFFLLPSLRDCYYLSPSEMADWAEANVPDSAKQDIRNWLYSDLSELVSTVWADEGWHTKVEDFVWQKFKCRPVMGRVERYWESFDRYDERSHAPQSRGGGEYRTRFIEVAEGEVVGYIQTSAGKVNADGVNDLKSSIIFLLERAGITTRDAEYLAFGDKIFNMEIKSTLGFVAQTTNGEIPKTNLKTPPTVSAENVLENEPPVEDGVLWLVNARVFGASSRVDFVMFDPAQTLRDSDGKATAQGGYVMRDGTTREF